MLYVILVLYCSALKVLKVDTFWCSVVDHCATVLVSNLVVVLYVHITTPSNVAVRIVNCDNTNNITS
jgi:hypothetical protein